MNQEKSIFKTSVEVPLRGGGQIMVNELSWPDALELYRRLIDQAKRMLTETGDLKLTPETLVQAISENIGIATWLVKASVIASDEWINQRSLSEMLDLATEAAVLNVGIIGDRLKNGQGRLREAFSRVLPAAESAKATPPSPKS